MGADQVGFNPVTLEHQQSHPWFHWDFKILLSDWTAIQKWIDIFEVTVQEHGNITQLLLIMSMYSFAKVSDTELYHKNSRRRTSSRCHARLFLQLVHRLLQSHTMMSSHLIKTLITLIRCDPEWWDHLEKGADPVGLNPEILEHQQSHPGFRWLIHWPTNLFLSNRHKLDPLQWKWERGDFLATVKQKNILIIAL